MSVYRTIGPLVTFMRGMNFMLCSAELSSKKSSTSISMLQSWPFMNPVNKKQIKDYYEVIKQPMDLTTLLKVNKSTCLLP